MDKFVMLFELFFGGFRTFNFNRSVNRIDNHLFLFSSRREMLIGVCDSFFHNKIAPINKMISSALSIYKPYLQNNKNLCRIYL